MSDLWSGKGIFWDDQEDVSLPKPPSYFEDPDYRATQDKLKGVGFGLLDGNIPDYYKSVGDANSQQFNDYLNLTNRDISQAAAEAAAKSGRGRGGLLPSVTSQAIADNTSKLRFADFLNSQEGKKFLFQQGRGITEGVRSAGQTEGANRNTFNLKTYDIERDNALWQIGRDDAEAAGMGKMLGTVAGGIGGFFLGGPAGAVAGAQIGSSVGGGGNIGGNVDIGSLFSKTPGATVASTKTAASSGGVSDIGRIGGTGNAELMEVLKQLHSSN